MTKKEFKKELSKLMTLCKVLKIKTVKKYLIISK